MQRSYPHTRIYAWMGYTLRLFLLLFYFFLVACLLLSIFRDLESARAFLQQMLPWFGKGLLTLGCGIAILSFLEAIR